MVAVAHANDGGGSIRIPASECGLVGLKPSRGRVSLGPDMGDAWHGLAIEHVVTRSVRDSAAVLDAIAGNMPGDPYSAPPQRRPFIQEIDANPGRLRIGVMKRSPKGGAPLHPDCVAAVEDVAKLLQSLGHSVEESHPAALDEHEQVHHFGVVVNCHTVLALEQIGAMVGKKIGRDDVELWTWTMAERGLSVSASEYLASIHWLQVWTRRIAKWWSDEKFDLLLTPTIAEPPPPLGELVTTREDSDRRMGAADGGDPVHAAVQRYRPAGDLAAAVLERGGLADRDSSGRRLRARGPASSRCLHNSSRRGRGKTADHRSARSQDSRGSSRTV